MAVNNQYGHWGHGMQRLMKEMKAEMNHSLYYYSDISHSWNKVVIPTDLTQGIFIRNKCQELWKV
jgi:hypothetical protein